MFVLALSARAQTALDGALAGRVTARTSVVVRQLDEDGHAVGPALTSVSGADGRFLFLRLAPADYLVVVLGAKSSRSTVSVGPGEVAELRPEQPLEVPTEDEEFAASVVEADEALPVAAPTTDNGDSSGGGQGSTRVRAALLTFRGLAPTQNATLLDGLSADQLFRGGPRGGAVGGPREASVFNAPALRTLRIAPHSYSAQYGGGAAGLLAITSRAATDQPHGAVSYMAERSAWNAANPFSLSTHYRDGVVTNTLVKPDDSLNAAAGRFGVGFRRLLYGFASLDYRHRDYPGVASPSEASFYALTPTQSALLGTRGVTPAAARAALNYLDSLTGMVPRSAGQAAGFVRLDVKPGVRDTFTVSGVLSHFTSPAGASSGPSQAVIARGRASVGDQRMTISSAAGRWLRLWTPRFTTEARFQVARDLESESAHAPLAQEPGIAPGGLAPQVSIRSGTAGAFRYGTPSSLGRSAYPDERRVQAAVLLQYAPARHLITLGGDWSRVREHIAALANTAGTFTYDSGARNGRAGGLVDWITDYSFSINTYPNGGCPAIYASPHYFCFQSFTQSFGQQETTFTVHTVAAFAQDLWRVGPTLTVELGARYEYMLLPFPQRPNVALDSAFSARGSSSVFPEDRNNVGPRVSVAWSPREGRWGTARVGYGVYFGGTPGGRVRAAITDTALPTTAEHIRLHPTTITPCPQAPAQGFGFPCVYVVAPPGAVATTSSAAVFARNFRLPMVQQAEVSLERTFGRGAVLRVIYSMANAIQLSNSTDINIAPSSVVGTFQLQGGTGAAGVRDGERFVLPVYTGRISNNFGPVTLLSSNANATWHGVTTETTLRRGTVALHAAYTFSRAIDYGPEQGAVPRTNSQFDPYNIAYDKGLSDLSFPHRLGATVSWSPTPHFEEPRLRALASGWRVALLTTAASGRPYSYEVYGGDELPGGSLSLNASGGSVFLPTVGRNTLRLPARLNTDVRVARAFHVTHGLHGLVYAEAHNVFNRQNAATANTRAFLVGDTVNGVTPLVFQDAAAVAGEGLNTPPFGAVTSTTTGLLHERTLQLGLRLTF